LTYIKLFSGDNANLYDPSHNKKIFSWPKPDPVYPVHYKPLTHSFLLVIAITGIFCSTGCQHKKQWQQEEEVLLQKAHELDTRLAQLNAQIDSLWDTTSVQLAQKIPADFPAVDRDIFIKARNADHIRMFMSYKQLDDDAKALVNQAGKQDSFLAIQVRALYIERQDFEQKKLLFLSEVEKHDKAASRECAEKLRSSENSIVN